jgi:hypothetical protein
LGLVLANNDYSRSEKNELMIEGLERGVLYNILAFNLERRDELIDFFARKELKRDLYKSLYGMAFYKNLRQELSTKGILNPQLDKKLLKEIDYWHLNYLSLSNDYSNIENDLSIELPSNFYIVPENLLLVSVNNNPAFINAYNHDYIKIATAVIEQMPPYGELSETVLKFNELLFKVPKSLYQNYSHEVFIQSDCSLIFSIIGINYELSLILENVKKLELEYAIKNNEYILAEANSSIDRGEKFLELKKIEFDRFKAFLFLNYLLNQDKTIKKLNLQNIPENIKFLLEKTILDIIKENM